jgi:LuxR family maltose regulon positive regulatory protein
VAMQLLNTKFHIPKINKETLVSRKYLLKKLDDALNKKLILIQAPAGFGKTTLLSHWIFDRKFTGNTCWLSLDKRDNHPLIFWNYVIEAFNYRVPGICGKTALQLHALQNGIIEDVLISMINGIEKSGKPIILILDDYHLIENKTIHDGLNFFIDHPIDNLLIIISTRNNPALGLSRVRVSGRLLEIREAQLKFSKTEMTLFINTYTDIALTSKESTLLYGKTEGWVAAIKLAVMSLKGRDKFCVAKLLTNDKFIQDYLMEEVFIHLPENLKNFLVHISILDRFNLFLCEYLTNDPETNSHIQYLNQHQLFLIPLDDTNHWFRFHHLFHDFLRSIQVIRGGRDQDSIRHLHLKAVEWFDENNCFEEAFTHALEAGRQDLAASVLAQNISVLYGEGGEQPLISYFERLTRDIVLSVPVLACYYYGIQMYSGRFEILEEMKPLFDKPFKGKDRQILEGFYISFVAYKSFYMAGDLKDTIDKCNTALELIPGEHGSMRRMLEYMQTISYRYLGRIKPALKLSRPNEADDLLMSSLTAMNRAGLDMELGNLRSAHRMITEKIHVIENIFETGIPPMYGFLYVTMGIILKEENKLKEAKEMFAKGINILKETGFIELIIISYGEYANLLTSLHQFDQAHHAIDIAIKLAKQSFSWVEKLLVAQKQKIWLRENKLDFIKPWACDFPVLRDTRVPFINSLEYLVLTRYFIELGEFKCALRILDDMIEQDLEDHRNGRLLECCVLKAKTFFLMEKQETAETLLETAFELSRNQGHVLIYTDEIKGMEPLYQLCREKQILPEYLYPHMNFFKENLKENLSKQVNINNFQEEFNTRELDILKLFQAGLSNKETADRLYLSVNTVRWYASRIFAKLDVKRRGQAVSKAMELHLI